MIPKDIRSSLEGFTPESIHRLRRRWRLVQISSYPSSSRPSAFGRESRDPSIPAARVKCSRRHNCTPDTWVPDRLAEGEPSGMTNLGCLAYCVKTSGKPSSVAVQKSASFLPRVGDADF